MSIHPKDMLILFFYAGRGVNGVSIDLSAVLRAVLACGSGPAWRGQVKAVTKRTGFLG